jgi:hypothetical protein
MYPTHCRYNSPIVAGRGHLFGHYMKRETHPAHCRHNSSIRTLRMKHVSKHSLMSQGLSLKHVIDDVARLHFRIFPERTSATEESLAPVWFGPLAFVRRTFSSLSRNSSLTFMSVLLSILDASVFPSLDEHDGQIRGPSSDLGVISVSFECSHPISVTCKFFIPFSICAFNLVTDSLVFPYFCVHLPPLAARDIKEEVQPANMYNSKSHLELGTQRSSLGL